MRKTILKKEDLEYISNIKKAGWNGSFDGSDIQMTIDEYLPTLVRVGINHENESVIFFNKKEFKSYLLQIDIIKIINKSEKEYQIEELQDCEFEHFEEVFDEIVKAFCNVDNMTYYINCFDFIRDQGDI